MIRFFILALFLSGLFYCQKTEDATRYSAAEIDSIKMKSDENRALKDSVFFTEETSPLKDEDAQQNKALNYFPYDINFRFESPLRLYPNSDSTTVFGTRENDVRPALKYGYVQFEYLGDDYRLQVIQIPSRKAGGEPHLFLGFTDQSTSQSTYGAGRYIDLDQKNGDLYIIDFNDSYNPYCAYNDKYSCALPPSENTLPFAVTAGEKIYKENH